MSLAQTLEGSTGPFIVGTSFSTFLAGVTIMQCFTYLNKTWPSAIDRLVYRWCVIGLSLLNITHTAFCHITLWLWLVAHYGDASEFTRAPWSFAMTPIMCSTAALVVQLFYAYRLYLLCGGHLLIPCLIAFGSFFQFAWGIGSTTQVFLLVYFKNFHVFEYGVACWFVGAAATDLLITSSLVWCLLRYKSMFYRTQSIVDRVIALTIETNGLTFTISLLALILFSTTTNSSHIAPTLCLIQFYISSFLVSLNSRASSPVSPNSPKIMADKCEIAPAPQTSAPITSNKTRNLAFCSDKVSLKHEEPRRIHVHTTTSVSTTNVSAAVMKSNQDTSITAYNRGLIRPDENNGFITNILGGIGPEQTSSCSEGEIIRHTLD